MCIGIPMQVIESGFCHAVVSGMGQTREVDTLLVGEQAIGTWLLVFLNSAREVLTVEEARRITDAVTAVDLVMQGKQVDQDAIDVLFADLINREPELPYQQQAKSKEGQN